MVVVIAVVSEVFALTVIGIFATGLQPRRTIIGRSEHYILNIPRVLQEIRGIIERIRDILEYCVSLFSLRRAIPELRKYSGIPETQVPPRNPTPYQCHFP